MSRLGPRLILDDGVKYASKSHATVNVSHSRSSENHTIRRVSVSVQIPAQHQKNMKSKKFCVDDVINLTDFNFRCCVARVAVHL